MASSKRIKEYVQGTFKKGEVFEASDVRVDEYSYDLIRKRLNEMYHEQILRRYARWKYYLPTLEEGPSSIEAIKSNYISAGHRTFGYFMGEQSDLKLGFDDSSTIRVVTNKEQSRSRKIRVGDTPIYLQKPHLEVTHKNWRALLFFSTINETSLEDLTKAKKALRNYLDCHPKSFKNYELFLHFYPSKTSKKLVELGLMKTLVLLPTNNQEKPKTNP